jgi:hypothetical protein
MVFFIVAVNGKKFSITAYGRKFFRYIFTIKKYLTSHQQMSHQKMTHQHFQEVQKSKEIQFWWTSKKANMEIL